MAVKNMQEKTGQCRCGQVRFTVSQAPLLTMACHCRGCQRMSASAFSLSAAIPLEGFAVTQGEPVIGGLHGEIGPSLLPALQKLAVHAL